jgi:3-oxoadipate enol-lactonase
LESFEQRNRSERSIVFKSFASPRHCQCAIGLFIFLYLLCMIYKCCLFALFLLSACSPKLLPVQSGTVRAGGYRVYYEQRGNGEPVVLVHAGLQNHSMWQDQAKALAKDFRVVTLDLPYHGNTTGDDTAMLACDVIKTVLDSLHVDKVAIAGLSMGAAITQDFLIAYPQRVKKAILFASGINGYEKKFPLDSLSLSWYPRFSEALKMKDTARAARIFALAWAEGIDHRDSLAKPVSRSVYATTLATLRQHRLRDWPHLQNDPPAVERLSSIRVPLLIVYGDKDLPVVLSAGEYLEKQVPGAKRVVLKGAAHMVNLEREPEVTRLMRDFFHQP